MEGPCASGGGTAMPLPKAARAAPVSALQPASKRFRSELEPPSNGQCSSSEGGATEAEILKEDDAAVSCDSVEETLSQDKPCPAETSAATTGPGEAGSFVALPSTSNAAVAPAIGSLRAEAEVEVGVTAAAAVAAEDADSAGRARHAAETVAHAAAAARERELAREADLLAETSPRGDHLHPPNHPRPRSRNVGSLRCRLHREFSHRHGRCCRYGGGDRLLGVFLVVLLFLSAAKPAALAALAILPLQPVGGVRARRQPSAP
eukprot:SAG11_NODE_4699_length_1798_cov_3.081717_2_plen_262_part_00